MRAAHQVQWGLAINAALGSPDRGVLARLVRRQQQLLDDVPIVLRLRGPPRGNVQWGPLAQRVRGLHHRLDIDAFFEHLFDLLELARPHV